MYVCICFYHIHIHVYFINRTTFPLFFCFSDMSLENVLESLLKEYNYLLENHQTSTLCELNQSLSQLIFVSEVGLDTAKDVYSTKEKNKKKIVCKCFNSVRILARGIKKRLKEFEKGKLEKIPEAFYKEMEAFLGHLKFVNVEIQEKVAELNWSPTSVNYEDNTA